MFDREIYFDAVRGSIFGGTLTQQQVDGQSYLLSAWVIYEQKYTDHRWFAYSLATTFHETASTMWPISEYGYGAGHDYGIPDPETGQTYYGRGFVQLTWRDNYARATDKLKLVGDDNLEWHADRALDPFIAARIMFDGMAEGWFTGKKLPDYFSESTDDAIGARKIINPDDKGPMIASYHDAFLEAIEAAWKEPAPPEPCPVVKVGVNAPAGVGIELWLNGVLVSGK